MNQYEVLYAVKDYDDADQFFADIGEAPRFWQSSWHLESMKVFANNMSDAQKNFYRKVEADDGRECVFVKAQFIRKLQYFHQIVVAVKVKVKVKANPNLNGWRIEMISVQTDSKESSLIEVSDLVLKELLKKYPDTFSGDYVFLEWKKPIMEGHLDVEG